MTTTTLTRDQVLAMEAGPEIDALVHGYMAVRRTPDRRWVPGSTLYSQHISAAWAVVEAIELKPMQGWVNVMRHAAGNPECHYSCEIRNRIYDEGGAADTQGRFVVYAEAPTAPLAICRAALLATMETP